MIARMTICFLFLPTLALAQSPPNTENSSRLSRGRPGAAAIGLAIRASVGYTYINLAMPSSGRVNLSGVNTAFTADILPRTGVTADFTYARASNLLNTGHHADVLSYLAGPVFYAVRYKRMTAYTHGLFGGARVTGVVPANNTYLRGYANNLSWALGGGVEYQLSPSIGFQVSGDYLRTSYFDSNAAIKGETNVRIVCSMVYSFSQPPQRRR
jgi:hypothetical protein